MDRIVSSWQGLGSREQIMVCFGVVALLLGLVFLLAVNPLLNWQETTQKRLNQTIADTTLVQQLAARVNAQKQAGDQRETSKGLSVLIDNSLRENKLAMRGYQPGNNNDARLRLENADYPALVQWLYDLEYRHGVRILELSLTPATVPGQLMVSLRVSK